MNATQFNSSVNNPQVSLLRERIGIKGYNGLLDLASVPYHCGFLSYNGIRPAVDQIVDFHIIIIRAVHIYLRIEVLIKTVRNTVIGK